MSKKYTKYNETDIYRYLGSLRKFVYKEFMNANGKNRCFVFRSTLKYLTYADMLFADAHETVSIPKKVKNIRHLNNIMYLIERELNVLTDIKQVNVNKVANITETIIIPLKGCIEKFYNFYVKKLGENTKQQSEINSNKEPLFYDAGLDIIDILGL